MEEQTAMVNDQSDKSTTETVTAEVRNPDAVLAKNRELLGKNKQYKDELDALRDFKSNQELAEKEAKGQHQEVIASLRQQLEETKKTSAEEKKQFAYSKFETQLKSKAQVEGCVNPDKLIKLMTAEQIKSVEMDEMFNVNGDDLTRLMGELKDEHSDIGLFGKMKVNSTSVNSVMTQGESEPKTETIDYEAQLRAKNFN
tara:strand:+ start:3342 stop:3938 length:597 start_codon:yes stop_codon:yes gene_type:complete